MSSSSSITINFQTSCQGEGSLLIIEADDEMNQGRSCFLYGEKYYFKVYMFPVNMVLDLIASDGTITPEGQGTDTIPITGISGVTDQSPEYVSFTNEREGSTSKPITDASGQADLFRSNCYWLSQSGLVSAIVNGVSTQIPAPDPTVSAGNMLAIPDPVIGVYRVQYPSFFKRYAISLPSRPYAEYPVTIYVTGSLP